MRQAESVVEDSGVAEDVHHLRLMARLLGLMIREKGNRGAAAVRALTPKRSPRA